VSPGQIVVLNGAPRSGKSSIAATIQETFDGVWVNLGVDVARSMTPARYQPGIGLRPGQPDHPAAAVVPVLYAALYESIAAHADEGVNVVTDVGHHDAAILRDCARRLAGRRAALVGVRCPIEVVMERRNASAPGSYATGAPDDPPAPVRRWQHDVHVPGVYDLDVDTSVSSPEDCADAIRRLLADMPSPTAFERLAVSEI
jgi:chloramphenicol 3-O phosphotransferase